MNYIKGDKFERFTKMLLICFLISLNFPKIASEEFAEKRLPQSVPINDLTFVAYEKRKPMFAEYGKRRPKFAEYGKRVPPFAEYEKRMVTGVDSKWMDLVQSML